MKLYKVNDACKMYQGLSPKLVLRIYDSAMNIRKEKNYGQRKITKEVNRRFGVNLSENTISGWIHKKNVPFQNRKTQFKPKPIPSKKKLSDLYKKQEMSASRIAQKFNVSTVTVIKWLKQKDIKIRSHLQSMNTPGIKKELREKRLTRPLKDYWRLTPEKAYVLGVLAGNGFIDRRTIRFEIRRDVEFIKEFSRCLAAVYGINYRYKYHKLRNSYVLYATSQIICRDLLKEGDFKTESWNVPAKILRSKNKNVVSAYLRGIYDSEGHVAKYSISFSSNSEEGVKGIQTLLCRLKIKSDICCYKKNRHALTITHRNNRKKFKELIGFTIQRKNSRL